MLGYVMNLLMRTEADAIAAGRPLASSLPSNTRIETERGIVENLRRDAEELHFTVSYVTRVGRKTGIVYSAQTVI